MTIQDAINTLEQGPSAEAYNIINNTVHMESRTKEHPNMDLALSLGFTKFLERDFKTSDYACRRALSSITHFCLQRQCTIKFLETEIPDLLVAMVIQHGHDEFADLALTCLGSMALHDEARKTLMDCGVLRVCLKNLKFLDGSNETELDFGMTAASLLCRLVGKEESGPGPEAIKSNDILIRQIHNLLGLVLDAGEDGIVWDYNRDPANIMLDISVMATSDTNKPLLTHFVPLVCRAIKERSDNERLIKYSIQTLSQLIFEPACIPVFEENEDLVLEVVALSISKTRKSGDKETYQSASVLRNSLESGAYKEPPKKIEAPSTPIPVSGNGHVMISYQWDYQKIATKLEAGIKSLGHQTWFDVHDMGPNINDSMANAVEKAKCIVVLFSRQYKESANCRRECELADVLQKPVVYVRVDPKYTQEGWLSLIMGKALWVPCYSEAETNSALEQIAKRLH